MLVGQAGIPIAAIRGTTVLVELGEHLGGEARRCSGGRGIDLRLGTQPGVDEGTAGPTGTGKVEGYGSAFRRDLWWRLRWHRSVVAAAAAGG
jgi:hypothetical protein